MGVEFGDDVVVEDGGVEGACSIGKLLCEGRCLDVFRSTRICKVGVLCT